MNVHPVYACRNVCVNVCVCICVYVFLVLAKFQRVFLKGFYKRVPEGFSNIFECMFFSSLKPSRNRTIRETAVLLKINKFLKKVNSACNDVKENIFGNLMKLETGYRLSIFIFFSSQSILGTPTVNKGST